MTDAERWALVQRVIPWIETLMTRFKVDEHEREDMRTHVYLYIVDHAERFEPERGALTTWARWMVRGAINDFRMRARIYGPKALHRSSYTQVPIARNEDGMQRRHSSLDVGVGQYLDRGSIVLLAPAVDLDRKIDDEHLPARISVELARLPAREATAIVQSVAGMTLTEIGGPMGVSRERARQLKERGLQRVRAAIGV